MVKMPSNKSCKWCEMGECWSHGQIAKPKDLPKKIKGKGKGGGGGKVKAQAGKGGGKAAALAMAGKGGGGWLWVPAGAAAPSFGMQGVKQNLLKQAQQPQAAQNGENHPKNKLSIALTMLLSRSVTKTDCVYEMTEENGKYTAVLTIAELTSEKGNEFKGKPAENKKLAEVNAAQKALNILGKEIKTAKVAYDEAQEEKRKEKAAINKEKREAKEAEKAAAAA